MNFPDRSRRRCTACTPCWSRSRSWRSAWGSRCCWAWGFTEKIVSGSNMSCLLVLRTHAKPRILCSFWGKLWKRRQKIDSRLSVPDWLMGVRVWAARLSTVRLLSSHQTLSFNVARGKICNYNFSFETESRANRICKLRPKLIHQIGFVYNGRNWFIKSIL
jgi:hypothetical protein